MTGQRRYTACCGLYCEDCIPSRGPLFEAVQVLAGELDRLDFRRYADLKAESAGVFSGYERFREYLSAIDSLRCPGPCAEGGGKKDCAIRACAHDKGYAGCWECGTFETCGLLMPFQCFHGDTPVNNLRLIREHGPDAWTRHRGPHYLWNKRPR